MSACHLSTGKGDRIEDGIVFLADTGIKFISHGYQYKISMEGFGRSDF